MGEQLSHEFSLHGVDTGRRLPDTPVPITPGISPDIAGAPQQPQVIPGAPIMRPSFLQAFLANLGPALAGGLAAEPGMPFGTGLSGALQGVQSYQEKQFQRNLQTQAAQRQQAQEASTAALQNAQTQRMNQITPLEVQEQQLNLQRQKGLLDLAGNSEGIDQMLAPMSASLGKMSPDEQSQLDAARGAVQANLKQGKFDVTPYNAAVAKISQDRIVTARGAEASPFKDWKAQFIKEKGREPNVKEIQAFQAAPRMMFAPSERIIEVADPDRPGETKFVRAGTAVAEGISGKGSASVQVPKNVLKWATTGEGAKQAGAFNTAMQHADLLTQAVKALNNGDQNTLNSLKNKFKNEFGDTGPLTAQVIASAYTREVNKMLAGGHMTDSDIKEIGSTLNVSRQSQQQALGALAAYKSLAASKMNVLYDQFQQGMQGKPNFGPSRQENTDVQIIRDSKGRIIGVK